MALKLTFPFPIFSPPSNPSANPNPSNHRPPTEIRFSRWNNANAEKFNERRRAQQEIEDDIRRHRRFDSATKISQNYDSTTSTARNDVVFRSAGTPSSPSRSSIPGRKSKYSKSANSDHPAFRKISKKVKLVPPEQPAGPKANVSVTEDGLSYVIEGAPFEFKYSYTETPKVKPLKLREAAFAPFGPTTMGRPWTGRAPLPPSKKKLREFDSFQLPPPNKKGVKPVQKPGPYLPGTGPRYASTREEILGEPLSAEEIKEAVESCSRSSRQMNMGRDGLTHNMLDNIHAHWKRRRVCKIKCKGVCTVDMDNVCEQLEERTGGKVIYRRGGVLYLFRGRNYNYRDRPRFPLMLWKPATPVYPRLIQRVPEGLTLEEATEMRKKGRKLIPICKLGKNGVYCDLAKNVREAFEVCELVRINCQGMNGSDYHKIGAKLRDLLQCVLISFEREHILLWRGRDWKSSLPKLDNDSEDRKESVVDGAKSTAPPLTEKLSVEDVSPNTLNTSMSPGRYEEVHSELHDNFSSRYDEEPFSVTENLSSADDDEQMPASESSSFSYDDEPSSSNENWSSADDDDALYASDTATNVMETAEPVSDNTSCSNDKFDATKNIYGSMTELESSDVANDTSAAMSTRSETKTGGAEGTGDLSESFNAGSFNLDSQQNSAEVPQDHNKTAMLYSPDMERVLHLMQQAVENGIALVLDDAALNADRIYERSVTFAKSAPPGPVFRQRSRKGAGQKSRKKEAVDMEMEVKREVSIVPEIKGNPRQTNRKKSKSSDKIEHGLDIVSVQGSLRVDELAKLLA